MRHLALIAAALLFALPAVARPMGEDERGDLTKSVDGYLRATMANNAEKIVEAIPPRILNIFAGSAGIEAKDLNRTLVDQTRALTKGLKVRDAVSDMSAVTAEDTALADGTAVTWAVVPMSFVAETGGAATLNRMALLALNEGGTWYFVKVDGPQQKQIAAIAYPFVAEAAIPEPVVSPAP
jgi:hypothetical protein